MSTESSVPVTHIGVLLLPQHDYLDQAGPVALITASGPSLLTILPSHLTAGIQCTNTQYHFITINPTLEPVRAFAGPPLNPTVTMATCPRLDVLHIPGPSPFWDPPAEVKEFIRKKYAEVSIILSICTAGIFLARCGILKGKEAMTNKLCLKVMLTTPGVREEVLSWGVKWAKKGRWCVDGKLWTSAGVTAGMDMASKWMTTSKAQGGLGVSPQLWKLVRELEEFTPKEQHEDEFAYILEDVEVV